MSLGTTRATTPPTFGDQSWVGMAAGSLAEVTIGGALAQFSDASRSRPASASSGVISITRRTRLMRSQGSRGGRRSCDWVFPVSHRFANVVAASTRAWCAGETSMRWTRAFLIVLALFSLGCVRGDWTETLTLVDVTGTWEGRFA